MYKNLKVSTLIYEMLIFIAKNKKPEVFIEILIQEHYNKTKK